MYTVAIFAEASVTEGMGWGWGAGWLSQFSAELPYVMVPIFVC